jgi:hypothetical protein
VLPSCAWPTQPRMTTSQTATRQDRIVREVEGVNYEANPRPGKRLSPGCGGNGDDEGGRTCSRCAGAGWIRGEIAADVASTHHQRRMAPVYDAYAHELANALRQR